MTDPIAPLAQAIAEHIARVSAPIDYDRLAQAVAARLPVQRAEEALWGPAEVAKFLSVSATTLNRLAVDPAFPAPAFIGGARRWEADAVRAWAKRQKAA